MKRNLERVESQTKRSDRESDGLENFLQDVRPRLRAQFARFRVPAAETEDILQQALLALLLKGEGIRNREAWLLGTIRKFCLQYWRQRRRSLYEAVDQTILEMLATPVRPEQGRQEALCDLNRLLEGLPSQCRQVLSLRYGQGRKPGEIAERLGYKRSSIGKITSRCMARLVRRATNLGIQSTGRAVEKR